MFLIFCLGIHIADYFIAEIRMLLWKKEQDFGI